VDPAAYDKIIQDFESSKKVLKRTEEEC